MGFVLSIAGSLLVGLAPAGALAEAFLMVGRVLQGLSGAFIMPASLALIKAYWDGAATPSTDAALSALPEEKAGSGSGIYKMASSLGASFGVAISATIFAAFAADASGVQWLDGVIAYLGRQDNVGVRQAAFLAFAVNLLMAIASIASVMLTIPNTRSGAATGATVPATAKSSSD